MKKRAAKFANNTNRICIFSKAYTRGGAWKVIGDRLLKICYLSRENHKLKIRNRKKEQMLVKYSFVKRNIES